MTKYARRERHLDYLAWLKRLPCAVESCRSGLPTEAAHVGERGLGQKCDDMEAIPLCVGCHRTGTHAQHRMGRHFWVHHGIDKSALIEKLHRAWRLIQAEREENNAIHRNTEVA